MSTEIEELRADVERSTRAIERLTAKINDLVTERVDLKSKLDSATDSNRYLLEQHGALGRLHEALKAERDDLARQLGAEVAYRETAEKCAARADGLFAQANADRDRLKHDLEQAQLTIGALKLLMGRAADAVEAADKAVPDISARELVAEMRTVAKP